MADNGKDKNSGWSIAITVALIGLLGTLGAALIGSWDKIFSESNETVPSPSSPIQSGNELEFPDLPDTSWLSNIVGRYYSKVENVGVGGGLIPTVQEGSGTTEFRLSAPDVLTGSYNIDILPPTISDTPISGTLSQCETLAVREIRCRWEDGRGTGSLEISFSDDLNSFDGYWNLAGSTETFFWRGLALKVR